MITEPSQFYSHERQKSVCVRLQTGAMMVANEVDTVDVEALLKNFL